MSGLALKAGTSKTGENVHTLTSKTIVRIHVRRWIRKEEKKSERNNNQHYYYRTLDLSNMRNRTNEVTNEEMMHPGPMHKICHPNKINIRYSDRQC